MDFDFTKGKDFVIVVENRRHKAQFAELGDRGIITFNILERDHAYLGSHSGQTGCVFFMKDGYTHWFRGKISSPAVDRVSVVRESAVETDRRQAVRMEVQGVPSQIKEPAFLRPRVVEAHLLDISRTGAKISPRIALLKQKTYTFETNLPFRHSLMGFTTTCEVCYCGMERGHLVSGLRFVATTPENVRVLENYISDLQLR